MDCLHSRKSRKVYSLHIILIRQIFYCKIFRISLNGILYQNLCCGKKIQELTFVNTCVISG